MTEREKKILSWITQHQKLVGYGAIGIIFIGGAVIGASIGKKKSVSLDKAIKTMVTSDEMGLANKDIAAFFFKDINLSVAFPEAACKSIVDAISEQTPATDILYDHASLFLTVPVKT